MTRTRTHAWWLAVAAVGLGAILAITPATLSGQAGQPPSDNLIKDLRWRNIGNANRIGRISSMDALEGDWTHVVVGSASGGVFLSANGGMSWAPIFDIYGAASIGDVRFFQKDPNIIWVGTGEECGRNTATWGDGVYKSIDGGKTFKNMGLKDSYTIGTVLTHPTDPNTVYVTALGNMWGPIGDRGFFKTTDGGATWTKLSGGLPNDPRNTGALYAVMDPTNPNIIYVSFWERHRTTWQLTGGGPNGGIFKTMDGGKTFKKLTKGLPEGPTGKIGLAVSRSNPKVLMTHYESGFQPGRGDPVYADMTKLGSGIYRSEDGGETWTYQNRYWSRPFYYNHVYIDPFDDKKTYHPNGNFQTALDAGKTLVGTGGLGGGDFHGMWLDPRNKGRYYVYHDHGLSFTHDGGQSWQSFKNLNVTQYYRVAVDMRDPYYICGGLQDNGSSCGPSMTRTPGIYNNEWFNVHSGDGMHMLMDPADSRWIYAERDPRGPGGDVRRINADTRESVSIRPNKGDNILNYNEYITPEIEKMQLDKGWGPEPGAGSGAFRWNWNQGLAMSPFDSRTIYLGANHLFKSTDRGATWWLISPDLSKNDPVRTKKGSGGLTPDEVPGGGAEYYGTIISVAESSVRPGVIWVGTDDGNVQVTENGGKTWTSTAAKMTGVPAGDIYVSRVRPSRFDAATCYVTLDGHRNADFKPYLFKTTDYGATWTNIGSTLPDGHALWVVEQDYRNPNLLFAGSELAVFYSIDGGQTWSRFNTNLPTVAVHDIVVHPRDSDVVLGTHGRGIWIMDDISGLQQLTTDVMASEARLLQNKVATKWLSRPDMNGAGDYGYSGENPSKDAVVNYWLGSSARGEVILEISNVANQTRRFTFNARPGLGKLHWDMSMESPAPAAPAAPGAAGVAGRGAGGRGGAGGGGGRGSGVVQVPEGTYRVKMTVNGKDYFGSIMVREDPIR